MFNPQALINQMLQSNPAIANNPIAQSYINVIRSGDSERGQQIAQNILNSYGVTKEEALSQAAQFFHLR